MESAPAQRTTMLPSGPILALDSSTRTGSVAVGDGEHLLAEIVLDVGGSASAALLPAIDEALRGAGLGPADLGAVVVAGGPGSFTGLRIGAATAKGIVHAMQIPLLAYSSLLAAAAGAWAADRDVCALFDARRQDVYAACYGLRSGVEARIAPTVMTIGELIDRFRAAEPPVFVGDGALEHRQEIERELGARVVPSELAGPRASSLLWLARAVPEQSVVEDAVAWEPDYIRASGAERIAVARRTRGSS